MNLGSADTTVPRNAVTARVAGSWWRWPLGVALGALLGVAASGPVEWFVAGVAVTVALFVFLGSRRRTELIVAAYWITFVLFSTVLSDAVIGGMFYPFYAALAVGGFFVLLTGGVRVPAPPAWIYVGFLFVAVAGLVGYTEPAGSALIERLVTLGFGVLVYLQFRSRTGVALVLRTAIVASALVAGWVIFSAVLGDFGYRGSVATDANVVSFYIGFGFLALMARLIAGADRDAAFGGTLRSVALLAPMAYALALLASRGIVIGILIASIVLAIRSAYQEPRRLWVVGALALTFTSILALPGGGGLLERFQDPGVATGGGRTEIWTVVAEEFARGDAYELVLGHGLGSSRLLVAREFAGLASAHNGYLQMVYEFGIIGLLLFAALHVWVLIRSFRVRDEHGWVMLALVTFLLGSNLTMTTPDDYLYWTSLGVLLAAGAWARSVPAVSQSRAVGL